MNDSNDDKRKADIAEDDRMQLITLGIALVAVVICGGIWVMLVLSYCYLFDGAC